MMSVAVISWSVPTQAEAGTLPPAEWMLGFATWLGVCALFVLVGGAVATGALASGAAAALRRALPGTR